ncbi:hypothetical protein PAAG_02428 [Paracoccidioides lutzii Pb01]|uniref:Uncharacterized protein n=1 Tax=Paracoccidioides lutzii (strain ATCC MYA-826 / Pb01) TaxID=502779 RepID=C1GUV5_PARBA|nr:hypothetical protein PAAG_02428 [Paracoccidioides lutzii Pb01]EEH40373.2 hypothetical protein PAAG_02428 [Paracoccidioides lutzii Pb01]
MHACMTSALFNKPTRTTAAEWQKELALHHRKRMYEPSFAPGTKDYDFYWGGGAHTSWFSEGLADGGVEGRAAVPGPTPRYDRAACQETEPHNYQRNL